MLNWKLNRRFAVLAGALLCMLMLALPAVQAAPQQAPEPPAETTSQDELPAGTPAAWDTDDSAPAEPPAQGRDANVPAAATDCFGWPTKRVRYTSDGVIHLEGCGQTFTLSEVAASPAVGPTRLELVDPANKIWLLKTKLKVEEGATLNVVGGAQGDANWLRLQSDAATGIWLRAERGNLSFRDTKVTSWDPSKNDVDRDVSVASNGTGGRSYIATRSVLSAGRVTAPPTACGVNGGTQEPYEARMDVINSEIGHLGYNAAESYGIVWKVYYKVDPAIPGDAPPPGRELYALADVFGEVRDSTFHHNYFGSYTYGAYCMPWSGNVFADNIQYGLDPHDDSDYLTISDNIFRDNGNHGVICSVECNNIVIVNNQSYRNQHGIMIHRNVNGALIEGNTSADNRQAGIAIFDSHDAVVRNNTVRNNGESAIRISVGSSRNLIEANNLTGAAATATGKGYVVYTYKGSDAPTTGDGKPKDNVFRANTMTGVSQPFWKLGDSVNNLFENNTFAGSAPGIELQRATGTVIRDAAPGTDLSIKLDTASTLALADTRGLLWQTSDQRDSTAASTGSNLDVKVSSSGNVSATLRDLSIVPASGTLTARPTTWDAQVREWQMTASAATTVAQRVGGLQAGACYVVTANSQPVGTLQADANGAIQFAHTPAAGTTTTFRSAPGTCSTPTAGATATPTPTPVSPTATATATPTPVPTPLPYRVMLPMMGN